MERMGLAKFIMTKSLRQYWTSDVGLNPICYLPFVHVHHVKILLQTSMMLKKTMSNDDCFPCVVFCDFRSHEMMFTKINN